MGQTSQLTTDHRPSAHGGLMTRTLQTLLRGERAPDAETLVAVLDDCVEPSLGYRCMNPECDKQCHLGTGQDAGRPARFCSRRCRQIFSRVRARLTWEVEVLATVLNQPERPSYEQRLTLATALAHRRWALERYPSRDEA